MKMINNEFLKNEIKLSDALSSYKIKCKKCGHSIYLPPSADKVLCIYCGCYRFRGEKAEFNYRLREKLYKVNRER